MHLGSFTLPLVHNFARFVMFLTLYLCLGFLAIFGVLGTLNEPSVELITLFLSGNPFINFLNTCSFSSSAFCFQ